MKLAICYFSATGRTARMAQAVAKGAALAQPAAEIRCFSIDALNAEHPDDIAWVNGADGVIFGTPDYYAGECWQLKKWLDVCPCKLGGKLGGCFATANVLIGGPEVAITHVLTHLIVQGMMVYSGGSSLGMPIIHLGPVCYRDYEEQGTELMEIFGCRFADKTAQLFG